MLPELKDDVLIDRFGGRFRLSAVIQNRWRELMHGARPMIDPQGLTLLEIALREIKAGKVIIDDHAPDRNGQDT